jgi:threonine/homoserine/homoserine lactone efflux protein
MDYTNTYDPNLAYPTHTISSSDAAATAAIVGVTFLFLFIFVIIAYAVGAFLLGRIFKKAGVEQWIAWVPIYSSWKTLELGGQQGFWAVLALIPFVNIISAIFTYIAMFHIGKKFGKEDWFVLLAIFLPIVWLIWLAFDDSKWPKPAAKKVADK